MNASIRTILSDRDFLRRTEILTILEAICQRLELTATQFDRAKVAYGAVGEWLSRGQHPLLVAAMIDLHGSGALGTSVRPICKAEFDVDLTCFLATAPATLAPAEAKWLVGDRLKEHAGYAKILEPKKRCWRLNYAGDFHLDISPTIANPRCSSGGQLVPDRDLRAWHPTNPPGYLDLFRRRAALQPRLWVFKADRQVEAQVAPFPEQQVVKGILRRTVQLLKRHRDVHFLAIPGEVAPISIVITTLAMRAYEACVLKRTFADELEVMVEVIRMMPAFIERYYDRSGREHYAIWNETTSGENFAERWNSEPQRVKAFYAWHAKALADFEALRDAVGEDTIAKRLREPFGDHVVNPVIDARTKAISSARTSDRLLVAPAVGLTLTPSAPATAVPKNVFFGD